MTSTRGVGYIGEDMVIKGKIRSAGSVEVRGYVEGSIEANRVTVQHGGRIYGTLVSDTAEINGTLQGRANIRNLISIGAEGAVHGDVRYGQLALASGGHLDADVRNVPPEIAGDLNVVCRRGRTVGITTVDLTAVDPDDAPETLIYTVSRVTSGRVARTGASAGAVERFTQRELQDGAMLFAHDGSAGASASFDVQVTDHAGATSGAAQTVSVTVVDQ